MPNYYQYFIASLPYLHFGMKAPMDFDVFLTQARDFIPRGELAVLENCADFLKENKNKDKGQIIAKAWRNFEFGLRNELVKIRAKHLSRDAEKYLRNYQEAEPSFLHKINEIARQPHSLEVERMLDGLRWNKLEELCFGHYFDIEFLFVYAQKLLILKRWDLIRAADKEKVFNGVINSIEKFS